MDGTQSKHQQSRSEGARRTTEGAHMQFFVQLHSHLANIQILGKRLASGVEEPSQPVKEKPKNHFNTLGLDLDLK